ncbi:MAG: hypothetical protein ACK53A_15605 [Gemmatimonadota bacterium]|jgi:hypothetical protein
MARRPALADHPVFGRSLAEVSGDANGAGAGPFASGDVAWLHRIARVPMWALDDDDLLLLVGRGRGLPHTASLALERLAERPLRGGSHGPGTLLLVVAALPDAVFEAAPQLVPRVRGVLAAAAAQPVDEALAEELALARERFA